MIVFLDRDGVINQMGARYITDPNNIRLILGAGPAIKVLNDLKATTIVVTNQSIVGAKMTTHKGVRRLHQRIDELLEPDNAEIDHYLYAWGTKTDPCKLRKPGIGMFQIADIMYDFDPTDSWIVGDNKTDIEFGQQAGLRTILVLTGEGNKWYNTCTPDFICQNILEASHTIKKES